MSLLLVVIVVPDQSSYDVGVENVMSPSLIQPLELVLESYEAV